MVPGGILSPYVAAGGGPVLRSVGSPSDEAARLGALGALSAGVRIGPGWRRVMLEARTGATVAGSVVETARTQRWTQLVIGGSFDFRQAPDPGE